MNKVVLAALLAALGGSVITYVIVSRPEAQKLAARGQQAAPEAQPAEASPAADLPVATEVKPEQETTAVSPPAPEHSAAPARQRKVVTRAERTRQETPVETAAPAKKTATPPPPPVEVATAEAPPEPEVARTAMSRPARQEPLQQAPETKPAQEPQAPAPPPRQPRTITIPEGTELTVRTLRDISSADAAINETFPVTLDQPLIIDGLVIAEKGADGEGRVVDATQAGRVKGRGQLQVELVTLQSSDGQTLKFQTDSYEQTADSSTREDAKKIGIGAAIGAAIGAIAGGGKGAAIGAGAGGAAGTGAVLATRGKDAEIPSETRLTFRLKQPLTVTEKLK